MRHFMKAVAAFALTAGLVLATAVPAQAADGYVYVVVNNSVCGNGGQVRGILANVTQTGFTTTSWDNGDNIVYPRVRLGARNQVNIQARCEKRSGFFWQTTGYRTVVGNITPARTGQTFWIG